MTDDTKIPYHLPHRATNEREYILDYHDNHYHVAEGGMYTQKCVDLIKERTGAAHAFVTSSCTGGLQALALNHNISQGDDIIAPSLGFSPTVFVHTNLGASVTFVDVDPGTWNMDPDLIEEAITPNTRAIAVMHYQGVACDMDRILEIANKHDLLVIEDAAQCALSYHNGTHLGMLGNGGGVFSTHATKNESSGLGGYIILKDDSMLERVERIYDKGTSRQTFRRGATNSFHWELPQGMGITMAEENAAHLAAQLEDGEEIKRIRRENMQKLDMRLHSLIEAGKLTRPVFPEYADHNAHMYGVLFEDKETRGAALKFLSSRGIGVNFHFLDQSREPAFELLARVGRARAFTKNDAHHASRIAGTMIRLPVHTQLTDSDIDRIGTEVENFFEEN